VGKETILNISEKKDVCACTYSFLATSHQNTVIHFRYYGKNSSIDIVFVKDLVKSILTYSMEQSPS